MNTELQQEERDLEFHPDKSGIEEVFLLKGVLPVGEPTAADEEELELWLDTEEPLGVPLLAKRKKVLFDFDKCYRLAETGASATEVAEVMGVEVHVVNNNIRARYGFGWREYSEKATVALGSEFKRKLVQAIRKGNDRLLVLYAQKFLGWGATQKVELSAPGGGPIQQQVEVVTISTEELEKRRKDLAAVIDRPKRFEATGAISETLTLLTEEEANAESTSSVTDSGTPTLPKEDINL